MPDLANGTSTSASTIQDTPTKPAHVQHIWIVTGPAGCGKSTVGNVLRTELGVPFLEGDDVSSTANCAFQSLHN
jgi:gluconokinase